MTRSLKIILWLTLSIMAIAAVFGQFGCQAITGGQSSDSDGIRIIEQRPDGSTRTIEAGKQSTEKQSDYSGPADSNVKQDADGMFTVKPRVEPFKNAKYLGGIFLLFGGVIAYLSIRKVNPIGIMLGAGIVGMGILAFLMPGLLVLLAIAAVGLAVWAAIDLWKHGKAQEVTTALAQTVDGVNNVLAHADPIIAGEVKARMAEKQDLKTKGAILKVKGVS